MSDLDVAAIREALGVATRGEWRADADSLIVSPSAGDPLVGGTERHADAELIVLLRNNAEALLDALADKRDAERIGAAVALRERAAAVRWCRENGLKPGEESAPYTESFERWLTDRAEAIEGGADL